MYFISPGEQGSLVSIVACLRACESVRLPGGCPLLPVGLGDHGAPLATPVCLIPSLLFYIVSVVNQKSI